MNKAKKIVGSVWIGKIVRTYQKNNKNSPSIKGKVLDETKNTFLLQTTKGIKKIIKKTMNFEIKHQEKILKVDGKLLQGKIESRMKKKVNK